MMKALSNHYFRQLRELYSVELQIISLIPEICDGAEPARLINEARERRDVLELIALDHDISAAGDDATNMRTLARQARAGIAECEEENGCREKTAAAACETIHRHTRSGYKVVSLLAGQLDFPVDAARLGKVLNQSFSCIVDFPEIRTQRRSAPQLLSA